MKYLVMIDLDNNDFLITLSVIIKGIPRYNSPPLALYPIANNIYDTDKIE